MRFVGREAGPFRLVPGVSVLIGAPGPAALDRLDPGSAWPTHLVEDLEPADGVGAGEITALDLVDLDGDAW